MEGAPGVGAKQNRSVDIEVEEMEWMGRGADEGIELVLGQDMIVEDGPESSRIPSKSIFIKSQSNPSYSHSGSCERGESTILE